MIGIVNYGAGNLHSVAGAVKRLGLESVISDDIGELSKADKLILPGVGAFGDGMKNLISLGLADGLSELVLQKKKPVLGICLGFQLMAKTGSEFGSHVGLGWIDATTIRLEPGSGYRLPHVGWNNMFQRKSCLLFDGVPEDALFYYVHSFHVHCEHEEDVAGECEYGIRFVSSIERKNIYGVQFHPEKSQQWGLHVMNNFLEKA